ncbi:MerR family transcriptional regulator [Pseudorhodobacter aquimaris]|uniref:hypothetical protein n=1 Tax=Pseudorhodobacter aquimaris TaxID=687412 RepID=UPI00067D094C|nr:hypothetical protein [Pseudorhodobacter aquimaris]
MKLTIDPLTPSEAAEVTGVSLDNQRNLRKQGYLPKNKGHARFSLLEVCRLLVIGALSERGIGPKVAVTFADTAARGILLKVLWQSELYSERSAIAAHEATSESFALDKHQEALALSMGAKIDEKSLRWLHGTHAKNHLVTSLESDLGVSGEKAPELFVYWANGHPEFFYGEDHPFADHAFHMAAWQGPAIMLSIGAMASLLASRLPHPIVHLSE